MSLRKVFFPLVVAAFSTFAAAAQESPKPGAVASDLLTPTVAAQHDETDVPEGGMPHYIKEETPEQRRERIATPDDPGINPDPEKVFIRFGKPYKIRKYEKEFAKYLPERPGFVRPMAMVNFTFEIYQENEKYVWVWMQEFEKRRTREERAEAEATKELPKESIDYFNSIRDDFTPLDPPRAKTKVRFEESSDGLPDSGSWRNGAAVADMNGDGKLDIVLPPQRAGNGIPAIFLGDGKGGWKQWELAWPTRINYGTVAAADFNNDKVMDLAFAIHLSGVAIFLGDGKGAFREVFYDKAFPSRRLITTDIDRDGAVDVVAITEGPTGRSADPKAKEYTALRGYLNHERGTKWDGFNIANPKDNTAGDWLVAANFNSDKYPDFLASTIYFNGTSIVHMSQGTPKKYDWYWDGKGLVIPFRSYYYGVTAGRFSAKDRDDAIVASARYWPERASQDVLPDPPLKRVVSLDRISWTPDGKTAKRSSIMRWEAGRVVPAVGHGDFNGDGKEDIFFTRHDPREAVLLLGDGKGGFSRADLEGIKVRPLSNYDVTIADFNADGRPDVMLMYESESATTLSDRNGSVDVFLNRGPAGE